MSVCWSVANVFAEHKDLQAVCLATSGDGKCALISRRSIAIIKSAEINKIDTVIKRETKWDTTYAEFSVPQPNRLAITNAQTIQIYNIEDNSTNSLIHTLRGHTRTITDLNWSHKEKSILASSSYDNFMHVWDLREWRKPVYSMHSIAGSTQVKWSKIDENILATSHDGDVRIWDKRKGSSPVYYISAHLSKINGIDWNPFHAMKFVTCSQDGHIKFWDLNSHKSRAEYHKSIDLPVWRARYTPFGNGLLTALVPQLRRTGENNSLWMWKNDWLDQPVHSFAGHMDVVLDFGWNLRSNSDFELVTWARDSTLRLWNVDKQALLKSSQGFHSEIDQNKDFYSEVDSAKLSAIDFSTSSNPSSPVSGKFESNKSEIEDSDAKSDHDYEKVLNLQQEFSLFNPNISNLTIEELDFSKRICIAAINSLITCRLKIFFPFNYPKVPPQFMFLDEVNASNVLNDSMKKEILKTLYKTASSLVLRNRICLEKCLRQFVQLFQKVTQINPSMNSIQQTKPTLLDLLPSHKYGSYLDASVPFPRTSGARFCSSEILVCFGRPPHLEQMNVPTEYTPRSLSALSAYLTSHVRAYNDNSHLDSSQNIPSISSFYIDSSKKRQRKNKQNENPTSVKQKTPNLCGPVIVFSVAKLLPISRSLAEQYGFSTKKDIINLCELNAKTASNSGRRELCQTWYLVKLSIEIFLKNYHQAMMEHQSFEKIKGSDFMIVWSRHPFGKQMIQSLIDHYVRKCNDIQTAAMIACFFSSCNLLYHENRQQINQNDKFMYNQKQNIFKNSEESQEGIELERIKSIRENQRRMRSSSWSEFCEIDDFNTSTNGIKSFKIQKNSQEFNDDTLEIIFDSQMTLQYDFYKRIYADILYRWKLIKKRAQLLKTIESEVLCENQSSVSFVNECRTEACLKINTLCSQFYCGKCRKVSLKCTICRLPVRGITNHCTKCGHGGHTIHMFEWFEKHVQCPAGCGCYCIQI